ncbi:MAG: hypothetical protein COA71_09955 [SAR86 cluster bacterium]|uniref:DUF3301 domain-containing protein n=1 Tax=SAR86 cluster bacterium TaxID=2030880 RepID=A0A2A5CAK6_9GAMM|nr:MAG: hypothetical protein COA71_09955 [SAR86 cluster bacterium]
MVDIYDVIIFFIFILLVMYWWRISEQKTFAIRHAKKYCQERNVQLLDQTLLFKGMRLEKSHNKRRKLCRVYEFDFSSNGEDRFKGQIILSGFNFLRVIIEMDELEITEY